MASLENGKTSKNIMAHRVVSPCISLKFYRLPTTPKQNALAVPRPLRRIGLDTPNDVALFFVGKR